MRFRDVADVVLTVSIVCGRGDNLKNTPTVSRSNATSSCASANPIEVVVAVTAQGRGVMGVVDGLTPKGVEGPADVLARKDFLRKIGYKL